MRSALSEDRLWLDYLAGPVRFVAASGKRIVGGPWNHGAKKAKEWTTTDRNSRNKDQGALFSGQKMEGLSHQSDRWAGCSGGGPGRLGGGAAYNPDSNLGDC